MSSEFEVQVTEEFELVQTEATQAEAAQAEMTLRIEHSSPDRARARELFERLLALRNDLGLYAEEYDVARARQVGNFPQAFTHLALINAARVLSGERIGTRSTPPAPLLRLPTPPPRPAPVKLPRP